MLSTEISLLYFVGICCYLLGIVIGINYLMVKLEIYYPNMDIYDVFEENMQNNQQEDSDGDDKNLIVC